MSKSDWGVVVALTGCLVLAALGLSDTNEHRYNKQRASNVRQNAQQIDRNRAGLPSFAEGYISNPDPKNVGETNHRDLAAQEASAVWAFWVVIVSLLGTLVTFVGTVLLYKQIILTRRAVEDTGLATQAMREANNIAKETMITDNRAWLTIHVKEASVWWHLGTDPINIPMGLIEIENRGSTTAKNISVIGRYGTSLSMTAEDAQNAYYSVMPPNAVIGFIHPGERPEKMVNGGGGTGLYFVIRVRYSTIFDEPGAGPRITQSVFSVAADAEHIAEHVALGTPYARIRAKLALVWNGDHIFT